MLQLAVKLQPALDFSMTLEVGPACKLYTTFAPSSCCCSSDDSCPVFIGMLFAKPSLQELTNFPADALACLNVHTSGLAGALAHAQAVVGAAVLQGCFGTTEGGSRSI